MWGFHDRLLTLRKALHSLLTTGNIWPALYRRWRLTSHLYNTQFGLILDETEWQEEWKSVVKLASSEPRHPSNGSANFRLFHTFIILIFHKYFWISEINFDNLK